MSASSPQLVAYETEEISYSIVQEHTLRLFAKLLYWITNKFLGERVISLQSQTHHNTLRFEFGWSDRLMGQEILDKIKSDFISNSWRQIINKSSRFFEK